MTHVACRNVVLRARHIALHISARASLHRKSVRVHFALALKSPHTTMNSCQRTSPRNRAFAHGLVVLACAHRDGVMAYRPGTLSPVERIPQ
jgi:hypothetical protein